MIGRDKGRGKRDGGRGNRMGAPSFPSDCPAASLEAIKVGEPRRNERRALYKLAVRPVRHWAELRWLDKKERACVEGFTLKAREGRALGRC